MDWPGARWSRYEDPLTYLPRKAVQEFAKGRIIYGPKQRCDSLFVVILGRVKVSSMGDGGGQTIARIVRNEGLFGESCLIGEKVTSETASALDTATLMSWTRSEIELQVEREPRLGIALAQYMVRQCMELQDRIESMAMHKTPGRVMVALLQLGEDLGTQMPDGVIRLASLTHHTIAEFVGTSREIVTFQMNRLRRLGMLRYSRKFIDLYAPAIRVVLREQGVRLAHDQTRAAHQATD